MNEMAIHAIILASEIQWMEKPRWLLSVWSQGIRYDLATKQQQLTCYLPACYFFDFAHLLHLELKLHEVQDFLLLVFIAVTLLPRTVSDSKRGSVSIH